MKENGEFEQQTHQIVSGPGHRCTRCHGPIEHLLESQYLEGKNHFLQMKLRTEVRTHPQISIHDCGQPMFWSCLIKGHDPGGYYKEEWFYCAYWWNEYLRHFSAKADDG